MDFELIQEAVASLKGAISVLGDIKKLREPSAISPKLIELTSLLENAYTKQLETQTAYFAVLNDKALLEKKVRELDSWSAEKDRYELTDLISERGRAGTLVYTIKDAARGNEPVHHICASCFQRGRKSILQTEWRVPGNDRVLVCHACNSDIYVTGMWRKEHKK